MSICRLAGGRPSTPTLLLLISILCVTPGCSSDWGTLASDPQEEGCPAAGSGITIGGTGGGGEDTQATPVRRLVLMGGGSEDDAAATLFVEAAAGGDILILRATGSTTAYPDYFTLTLSPEVSPASAVTVRTDVPASAAHESVFCRLDRAEAVWLAGGSQWDYLGEWPPALHSALAAFASGGGALGGTSAGAVSLGEGAFDAEEGTVTSAEALADPLRTDVSLSYPDFAPAELQGVLVDSHFSERDREGRLLVFLARFLTEKDRSGVVGVGLDERTALVIESGAYQVFGPPGSAVWLYQVTGPATLALGTPLDLEGIARVRLESGDAGAWPFDFQEDPGVFLQVKDGVLGSAAH